MRRRSLSWFWPLLGGASLLLLWWGSILVFKVKPIHRANAGRRNRGDLE
jgi:hypothetical protein